MFADVKSLRKIQIQRNFAEFTNKLALLKVSPFCSEMQPQLIALCPQGSDTVMVVKKLNQWQTFVMLFDHSKNKSCFITLGL